MKKYIAIVCLLSAASVAQAGLDLWSLNASCAAGAVTTTASVQNITGKLVAYSLGQNATTATGVTVTVRSKSLTGFTVASYTNYSAAATAPTSAQSNNLAQYMANDTIELVVRGTDTGFPAAVRCNLLVQPNQ